MSVKQRIFLLVGLASIPAVVLTPIGTRSSEIFTFHMIQHITLMMVTGPLLVLATPATFHPTNRIFQLLTQTHVSWFTYAALMIGVHLPAPHNFLMMNPWAHSLIEIPLYVALPYLFYFNLLDRNLVNRRVSPAIAVISLFLMMVPETLTGFFIYVSQSSLYSDMYEINDQRRGGSIMWSGAMIIDACWIALAVSHWYKSEVRRSVEVDAEIAGETRA